MGCARAYKHEVRASGFARRDGQLAAKSSKCHKQFVLKVQASKKMAVAHTSKIQIEKRAGPHRTALIDGFDKPLDFGIHGGIKHFYQEKYGREIKGPEYPATLDHMIAGVAG